MQQQLFGLPYQAYGPVREQLYMIAKAVNRIRRRAGLTPVDYRCIPRKMRVTKVFVDHGVDTAQSGDGATPAMAATSTVQALATLAS